MERIRKTDTKEDGLPTAKKAEDNKQENSPGNIVNDDGKPREIKDMEGFRQKMQMRRQALNRREADPDDY